MPDAYVVDTDIVSYLYRKDTRARQYEQYLGNTLPSCPS
jgi:predicted nucleic acid-binding protein